VADYEAYPKQLIGLLKFGRVRASAKVMAGYMQTTLPFLDEATVITFVPTATSRVRQRGYDQAHLLAKELSRLTKRKTKPLLGRLGQTRQVGATRKQRLVQLQNAFFARNSKAIKGAHILLVDDVLTTGATLEAAAKTLRQTGAKSVSAVVFAQKRL
jgi:ComF family protein